MIKQQKLQENSVDYFNQQSNFATLAKGQLN
jgi:hypothetical protein